MTRDLLYVSSNTTGQVRRETLDGREYLVAPVVALVAGVVNGELAPLDELARHPGAWNGRPVPLAHPLDAQGLPISANSPEIEAQVVVGRLWNFELEGDRLQGEIWLDIEKAQRLGGDAVLALELIERGEGIEVSTGYWRDLEEKAGRFNGKRYVGIQHNIVPDHLALLLHQIGACSWKDGCGVPRVNQLVENAHTGVMVALYPQAADAEALALEALDGADVLPVEELHVTLAYMGDLASGEVRMQQEDVLRMVMDVARNTPVVHASVAGVGRFTNDSGGGTNALFALINCQFLQGLHWWMVDMLSARQDFNGYLPHMTLAYIPADAPMPNVLVQPREIIFDRIGVAWGGQVTMFALQGEPYPVEAVPATDAAQDGGSMGTNAAYRLNPVTWAKAALRTLAGLFGGHAGAEGTSASGTGELESSPAPAENSAQTDGHTEEEPVMEREQLLEQLAANANHPFTREDLEAMSDGALGRLAEKLKSGCSGQAVETPAVNDAEVEADAETAAETAAENTAVTATADLVLPEELAALSALVQEFGGAAGLRSALEGVRSNADQHQAGLVSELAANERCAFSREELEAMPVQQLEKLAASLRPVSYAGRGGPRGNQVQPAEQRDVPPPPKVVLTD
jgi:2'-5' RNA ligase